MLAKKPENMYVRSMVIQMSQQPSNRLIEAYNQMMASIRSAFETSDDEEMSLSKAMAMARDEITHISDVTQDEAEEISNFIKRDINDAAEYMMETSSEFSDWLMLDIEVIERKLIDLFLSVAVAALVVGRNVRTRDTADGPLDAAALTSLSWRLVVYILAPVTIGAVLVFMTRQLWDFYALLLVTLVGLGVLFPRYEQWVAWSATETQDGGPS